MGRKPPRRTGRHRAFLSHQTKRADGAGVRTYNSLDEKYIEYLKLCLDHPNLDVFDTPNRHSVKTPDGERKTLIIFSVLFAILERAFLMYRDKAENVKRAQWGGWQAYIDSWVRRDNFRRAWAELKGQYDAEFEHYLTRLLRAHCDLVAGEHVTADPTADDVVARPARSAGITKDAATRPAGA